MTVRSFFHIPHSVQDLQGLGLDNISTIFAVGYPENGTISFERSFACITLLVTTDANNFKVSEDLKSAQEGFVATCRT